MNATSLLSDTGYPPVDAAIAGTNANSGGSQSNFAAEEASQFGDVLAGVTASSTPPPQSDAAAPWRSGLAMRPSLEPAAENATPPASGGSTQSGRTRAGPASEGNAATNETDFYSAALGRDAASATGEPGSEGAAAYSGTEDQEPSIPNSPASSNSVTTAKGVDVRGSAAQSQAGAATAGARAERGDTLALLRKIVGSQFSTSADPESSASPPPLSSSSDPAGASVAVAASPARPQAAAASVGSTAEAGNTFVLFQKIIGARFATGNSPSKAPSATPDAAADSDPRSTGTAQGSDHERSTGRQSSDAASATASSASTAAALPNAVPAAVLMMATGTFTPAQPAFNKTTASGSANPVAATGPSIGTGAPAGLARPTPSDGGTTEALPAEVSAALAESNAKVTSRETHLPPTMPLSPMNQIFNTIVSATSTLEAPAGSSDASPGAPALPTAAAVTKTMILALEPDELGKVEINMSLSNGQLNVVIGVDRSATLQRLRDDQDTLVTSLGSSGYDIRGVTIHGAAGDLASFSSQSQTAGGQGSTQQSATNVPTGQSGSGSGQGRSGNDSFAERNDNGSTGSRQDQPPDQTVTRTSSDGLYV